MQAEIFKFRIVSFYCFLVLSIDLIWNGLVRLVLSHPLIQGTIFLNSFLLAGNNSSSLYLGQGNSNLNNSLEDGLGVNFNEEGLLGDMLEEELGLAVVVRT